MDPFRLRSFAAGILAVTLAALSGDSARAQNFTWNVPGPGIFLWSTATNWVGGATPGNTTTLTFGATDTLTTTYTVNNDNANPFIFNNLIFNNTAGTVTLTGTGLTFSGASAGMTINGVGNLAINTSTFTLAANTTLSGPGTAGVSIGSAIDGGAFNLIKAFGGPLVLSGGGTMNQLSARAGSVFITGGVFNFTQPNDPGVNSTSGLQLGNANGQIASVSLSNGATINVTENTYLADAAGSTGTLTVTGNGTTFNNTGPNSGRLGVGNFGTGFLNVTSGGVLNVQQLFAARQNGSTGTVVVDGTGSLLHSLAQLSFGSGGAGTMTVQNGGTASSDANINIGRSTTAGVSGTVTVTGAGSSMTTGVPGSAGGTIFIGANGPGTLNVRSGATVTSGFTANAGQIAVGDLAPTSTAGAGTLSIESGGVVTVAGTAGTTGNFFAALAVGTTANITVTGANSRLAVSNFLNLSGGRGTGVGGAVTLTVADGGRITSGNSTIFGLEPGGSVNATLTGTGSMLVSSGTVELSDGNNTLAVQNGASISSAGDVGVSIFTGTSTVSVTGTGSAFTMGGGLFIGGDGTTPSTGTGSLTVGGGGAITATGVTRLYAGSSITVNTGGTFSAGGIADGTAGTNFGTVNLAGGNLNLTNTAAATFNGVISGSGAVTKSGAGTQTFSGVNTYSGGTTINAGTLTVTNAGGLGTGNIFVASGATLSGAAGVTIPVPATATLRGSGTVAAPISVAGTLAPGASPGILTATGNVTFAPTGTFAAELNGNTPGNTATNHDQLLMTGTAPVLTLGGATLSATLGYTPSGTDRLFIIVLNDAAGSVTGTFGNAPGNTITIGGFVAQVTYTGDSGTNNIAGGNDVALFNFTPVPEPTTVLGLAALGGLAFRLRRRFV